MHAKLKVLIVEDDPSIAEITRELLEDGNYEVCGVADSVGTAMASARIEKPDIAMIDLGLANHESGTDVAVPLQTLGRIGILYTTGNVSAASLANAVGEAGLMKPYSHVDLLRALELVAEIVTTGEATPPFPPNFRRLAKPA